MAVAGGLIGAGVGAFLDPLGQTLADRSRAADQARHQDRLQHNSPIGDDDAVGPGGDLAPAHPSSDEHLDDEHLDDERLGDEKAVIEDGQAAPPEESTGVRPGPSAELLTPAPLLPLGRSAIRTSVAAAICAVVLALAGAHFGRHLVVVAFWALFLMLVTVSVTDLTHRLVPRPLVYGALAVMVPIQVIVAAVNRTWHDLGGAAIAGAVAFGIFFLIWFFVPRGMGFGDVRLAGAIGVGLGYLSLVHAYLGFLAAFLIGLLIGVVALVVSSEGRKTRVPFAPALAAGAILATLWGSPLAHGLFPGTS